MRSSSWRRTLRRGRGLLLRRGSTQCGLEAPYCRRCRRSRKCGGKRMSMTRVDRRLCTESVREEGGWMCLVDRCLNLIGTLMGDCALVIVGECDVKPMDTEVG